VKKQNEVTGSGTDIVQVVSFSVGEEDYGINIETVKEVIKVKSITQLPKTPSFVRGVINLRGDVIPIIDLREKFGLQQEDYTEMTRVIVVDIDDKSIGMVVDSVSNVINIAQNDIDPPPPLVSGLSEDYLKGVGKVGEELIILLNIDKILTAEEKIDLSSSLHEIKEQETKEAAGVN